MYTVYVIRSKITGRYYIGHTENFDSRLARHNAGLVHSTRSGRPWDKVRTEDLPSRSQAYRREQEIKKYKGGILFKKLLGVWKDG